MRQQYDRQWDRCLKNFLFVLVLLISIPGCDFLAYQNPSPVPTPNWWADFFTNTTCIPPCWDNITPGKTSMKEAQRIVQSRNDIENFKGPSPVYDNFISVSWKFKNSQTSGSIGFDVSGTTVLGIGFQIDMQLNQIIEKIGFPDQVIPQGSLNPRQAGLDLIYTRFNLALMALVEEKNGVIQITPHLYIFQMDMSTTEGHLQYMQQFNQNQILKWHGYGEYLVP
jgi:hypothetical protein